jgi:putative membrane protein
MKNKLIVISIGTLACLYLSNSASAQNPRLHPPLKTGSSENQDTTAGKKGAKLSAKDKSFMMNAGKGGQMEVNWGKVAAQHAQNADVKKFGNRMVTDHSQANSELMALAKEEGVTIPTEKAAGKWKSDKDYMDMMLKDHEKDLAEFQNEASNGTDADLKKFADKYSKVVKKHLDMAKEIQGKLK